jgi:hypothetical protein
MTDLMASFIAELETSGRICPQPLRWNELWEMLPERKRVGNGWNPPLPLILAAWWEASDEAKHSRFLGHLEWADEHGTASSVVAFLRGLAEGDWYGR